VERLNRVEQIICKEIIQMITTLLKQITELKISYYSIKDSNKRKKRKNNKNENIKGALKNK